MKKFQKKVEDFTCEHCGAEVKGTGYTNHCPKCLWSKHVDVNPGDRASLCGGMMPPVSVEQRKGGEFSLVLRCEKCRHERRNILTLNDNMEEAARIQRIFTEKK